MKTRLDAAYLTILAALGLELGCSSRPLTVDASGTEASESGSSSSASTGDGDPTETETGGPVPFECENPIPIMQGGTQIPSGFYECEDGFVHRAEAIECEGPPQGPDDSRCVDWGAGCQTAADCVDRPYGSCGVDSWSGTCVCSYGCASDADCSEGSVCACSGVGVGGPTCIPGDCGTSIDCGEGLCGLSHHYGGCGDWWELACTTPEDECHSDDECSPAPCIEGEGEVEWYCASANDGGWTCQGGPECLGACGRPLLVEGKARIAAVHERADWRASIEIDRASLDAATREQLATHWLEVGRYEHASVASFARFAGHLLRLGAPPQLLRETSRAMADEVEHARLAFGLASAYADCELGPGPLEVRGAIEPESDRQAIVEALIVEACVGETLAAVEAREAAAWAEEPAVAAALEQIAADELRHAALGWRTLRWMLDRGDDHLRRFALVRLDTALAEIQAASVHDGVSMDLRVHGVLDDAARQALRRRALVELLEPCTAALRARVERVSTAHV
jgi:hypothetical protein